MLNVVVCSATKIQNLIVGAETVVVCCAAAILNVVVCSATTMQNVVVVVGAETAI